jgi:C4-dicarboxylate-specific signal transduction histidine kinase
MRQQIAVLDRRRSLGEMAAALGHELKQPLTAVLTSAQVAQLGLKEGRLDNVQLGALLARIADGVRRSNSLIERIGGFVRPSSPSLQSIDLNDVAREAIALSEGSLKAGKVRARVGYSPRPLLVNGDALQLSQVVLNLIRNGIEATEGKAQRELDVECLQHEASAGIRVRDNGQGFSEDIRGRLGSPFFTTKTNGMGMGLAIAQSICRQHGGGLKFSGAEGGGAQVEMFLPLQAAARSHGVSP